MAICWKSLPGRRKDQCKGPEAEYVWCQEPVWQKSVTSVGRRRPRETEKPCSLGRAEGHPHAGLQDSGTMWL